jgi:NTE family protein
MLQVASPSADGHSLVLAVIPCQKLRKCSTRFSGVFCDRHDVRHAINELHKLLPPDLANTEQAKRLYEFGCVTEMDIVQLVYRPTEPQGASKVCEFSGSSMEARWQQGISNARTALHASPWLAPTPRELGVRVFDVM